MRLEFGIWLGCFSFFFPPSTLLSRVNNDHVVTSTVALLVRAQSQKCRSLLLLRYLNGMNVILFINCKLDGIYHINHLKCYLPPACLF